MANQKHVELLTQGYTTWNPYTGRSISPEEAEALVESVEVDLWDHEADLQRGVAFWNEWRYDNPGVRPELSEADLALVKLQKVNLADADLVS